MTAALHKYRQMQNETASKERLMLRLFETALQKIRFGIGSLERQKDRDAVYALTQASDIVDELRLSLRPDVAPELSKNLLDVYKFVELRLTLAAAKKDAAVAREAERVFAPIVDAFQKAVAQATQAAR